LLSAHGLTYHPPAKSSPLWPPLELDTGDARFVLLSGRSGSGKSTFLRILCSLLPGFRGGRLEGRVNILGRPIPRQPDGRVGLLFQNTDAMLHSPRVADELTARARAAQARDTGDLRHGWLAELVDQLELGPLLDRKIVELSGGQQQRVAFAAVLAGRPDVVLLDEPTSNLDPQAAAAVVRLASGCANRFGTRFVAAEHRAEHVLELVDGAIQLSADGGSSWSGTCGAAPPEVLPEPLDLGSLRSMAGTSHREAAGEPVLHCRRLSCRRSGRLVLCGIDLELRGGELVGLTGPNGAGKSSLLLVLAGGLKPTSESEILLSGQPRRRKGNSVGLLMQNPLHQLFCDTVRHEVALAAENAGHANVDKQVEELLRVADLSPLADRVTLSLSYGEQQRTALAGAISAGPSVVLLDEPTHGMDAPRLERLIRFVLEARRDGTAFVVASHDDKLLGAFCDRVLVLHDGKLD
jgi:energy-coupling factor transporter ATP-binding protein EcfA2